MQKMRTMSAKASSPKNWLITGVSTGLGRAVAQAALKRGDRVAGTVRTEKDRDAFRALAPERAIGLVADVTDEAAIHAAVDAAENATGGIDILVNNAGYGLVAGIEEASLAEIRAQFDVNVFGAIAVLQAVLPHMRARRRGRILNITSVSGFVGWPSLGIYSASKFAFEGIGETLALEVEPLGIKLTMIEPGGLRTDFATRSRVTSAREIADYDATVGACRRILAEHAGREPGDTHNAAQAILQIADVADPPLRLLLGTDALGYAISKLDRQRAEIVAWETLTKSVAISG